MKNHVSIFTIGWLLSIDFSREKNFVFTFILQYIILKLIYLGGGIFWPISSLEIAVERSFRKIFQHVKIGFKIFLPNHLCTICLVSEPKQNDLVTCNSHPYFTNNNNNCYGVRKSVDNWQTKKNGVSFAVI